MMNSSNPTTLLSPSAIPVLSPSPDLDLGSLYNYSVLLAGPEISFEEVREGRLRAPGHAQIWVEVADLRTTILQELPAQWQEKFLKRWARHRDGATAVLARCRELVREHLTITPDDQGHRYLERYAWLCGAKLSWNVPKEVQDAQKYARDFHPGFFKRLLDRIELRLNFGFRRSIHPDLVD